jgi:hypothetical protein
MQLKIETSLDLYYNSYGYTVEYEATIMVDKGDYDTPGSVEWDFTIQDIEREHNDSVGVEQLFSGDLDQSTLDFINESINDDIDSNWENFLHN